MGIVIWHNPRCSKSCETLALLKSRVVDLEIINYLETPPSAADIHATSQKLGGSVRDIIRSTEDLYRRAGLVDSTLSECALAEALAANPSLIQRPIVFANGKAAIGRPPKAVLAIL